VRTLLAALTLIVMIGVASIGGATPAAADDDSGMRLEGGVTYELQPEDERVRVTMELTLTNLMPDQGLRYFYFDEIGVGAPAEAANVRAERLGGGALSVSVEEAEDPTWSVLAIRLSPVLRYGNPQRIRVTFDLPNQPPRSDRWTRVSPAFAQFPIYPVGDPGRADVTVIVPDVYEDLHVGGAGDEMERSTSDDKISYEASDVDPTEWWAMLAARNNDLLDQREFSVGDLSVALRYWPGDDEWADFVEEVAAAGIPILEELIGQPWPGSASLEIIESSAPHAYGAGGWYDSDASVIEVGDSLDPNVMMHELSHGWFNHETTADAWLREGLAELFGYLAVDGLDGYEPEAEPEPSGIDEEVPLAEWDYAINEYTDADQYGYETSWWLWNEIYSDIGAEALTEVLAAALNKVIPYQSGPEAEIAGGVPDWMRFLDLLEEVAGYEGALELYQDYVVDGDDAELLSDRSEARETYAELLDDAAGWGAPLELRRHMTFWRFDDVAGVITSARDALALRDGLLTQLGPLGVTELPVLEASYQAAARIVTVIEEAEEYASVAAVLSDAAERPSGAAGLVAHVGSFGVPLDDQLADAAAMLAAGDVDESRVAADDALRVTRQAPLIGAIVAAQLALCLALLGLAVRQRRRRRHAAAVAVSSGAWPIDEASSSPSTP
jgi:hypothetical protein